MSYTRAGAEATGGAAKPDPRWKVLRLMLMKQGLKLTPQRRQVAEAMFAEQRHVSADELVEELQREGCAAVSRASVYRTLQVLEQARLVRAIDVRSSCRYYERAPLGADDDHEHLVCIECGLIVDVPCAGVPTEAATAAESIGFRVVARNAQTLGVCDGCASGGGERRARS